ncbi:MAG: NAD+ synthase [Rhodobacteraceae bacterium]|nr:NAD+ synthase [Paracoccaceae bacterium]
MANTFKLALAQYNPTVGALEGNSDQIVYGWRRAAAAGADMVAFPELFLSGYPVQDLVLKPAFLEACRQRITELAAACAHGPAIGFGAPGIVNGKRHNCYYVLQDGEIAAQILKHHLPNAEVFDEARQFEPGPVCGPYRIGPVRIGSPICEDAWLEDVSETLVESGAEILLVPNGSPYHRGKLDQRYGFMVSRVVETGLPLVYLNMVGGQDDQIFDGGSFVLNRHGRMALQMPHFDSVMEFVTFRRDGDGWKADEGSKAPVPCEWEQDYRAMVESVREYLSKSGFSNILVGLSGGIDSAFVATIAADAVGPDRLRCVMLPSEFTSPESLDDARRVSKNLGCRLDVVGITDLQQAADRALAGLFAGCNRDLTEENIQSRLRGLLLMAVSNKFGELLLTTGNKSESAVGYATIYGDMAGGYNPIKDLYKTRVFESCRWRNANHRPWMLGAEGHCVPESVLTKPPSAELRPDQRDSDSLPDYGTLDGILEILIDKDQSVADAVAAGYDMSTVKRVEQLIYASEYKRFQSAPGVRLTGRALWLDRRYPIVNRWRDTQSGQ